MGDFLTHLAHAALWVIGMMFVFSLIGIFAPIRSIGRKIWCEESSKSYINGKSCAHAGPCRAN